MKYDVRDAEGTSSDIPSLVPLVHTSLFAAPTALLASESGPPRARILIVDDDEWIRDVLERVLLRHHYYVKTAVTAEQALQQLLHSEFDLLLSDVLLPGMNGLDLVAYLLPRYPHLSLVLMTAQGDTELMRRALRMGISDFLPKPFSIETIPLIVERSLERHALERARMREQDESLALATVQALSAAIDAKEPFTARHSRRVATIAGLLGDSLCLSVEDKRLLDLAAQVHDVGKIAIPDEILNKPGKLNAEEWEAMRLHPARGAEIVGGVKQLTCVADIVHAHHEWLNGAGYPIGLQGEAIPRLSRVLSVADAYEVMTSDRVYRTRFSDQEALSRLREAAGLQFDPIIVEAMGTLINATGVE